MGAGQSSKYPNIYSNPDELPCRFKVRNDVTIGESSTVNISQKGLLEITDDDIKLYQRHRDPLIWKFRCLRRYGFGNDTFIFESGRSCETGPSLFAFKSSSCINCSQSLQEIFTDKINKFNQDAELRRRLPNNGTLTNSMIRSMRTEGANLRHLERPYVNNAGPLASAEEYLTPISHHNSVNGEQYMNSEIIQQSSSHQQYINTQNQNPANIQPNQYVNDIATNQQALLFNGTSNGTQKKSHLNYVDLDLPSQTDPDVSQSLDSFNCVFLNGSDEDDDAFLPPTAYVNVPSPTADNNSQQGMRKVLYSETRSTAPSVHTLTSEMCLNPSAPYTTIDFQKTQAIATTTKQKCMESSEGSRKTRHDSAADDLD